MEHKTISAVAKAGVGEKDWLQRGLREILGLIEIPYTDYAVVTQSYPFFQMHTTVQCKMYKFYYTKATLNKPNFFLAIVRHEYWGNTEALQAL
jgi:hypothetical protein